jgi:hypothetical protein
VDLKAVERLLSAVAQPHMLTMFTCPTCASYAFETRLKCRGRLLRRPLKRSGCELSWRRSSGQRRAAAGARWQHQTNPAGAALSLACSAYPSWSRPAG